MGFKRNVPNLFTLSNLICGTLSVYFASTSDVTLAAVFVLAGALFDFLDGMVARLLNVSEEIGKQLDSLADLISFGLAPAFIALALNGVFENPPVWGFEVVLLFFPLIMVAFSAYRLAKFNLDQRQTEGFLGLPTPANALFWLSLPLILNTRSGDSALEEFFASFAGSPMALAIASLILSILLVSEIPLISLKFKNFKLKENARKYTLIVLSLLLFAVFAFNSIPIILLLYLILSISKKRNGVHR